MFTQLDLNLVSIQKCQPADNFSINKCTNLKMIFIWKTDLFEMPVLLLFKCTDINTYLAGGIGGISKVAGVMVYQIQTWNLRSCAVSACINLWHHMPMHAPNRLIHACTACIAPWCHRPMHAVTASALLFWFCLGYIFISSYFDISSSFFIFYVCGFEQQCDGIIKKIRFSNQNLFEICTLKHFLYLSSSFDVGL